MVVQIEFMVIAVGVLASFWGWLAVKVIDQGRKLVELEARVASQEKSCAERLQWMREMEKTLNQVAEDTLAIRTKLGENPHA